MHAVPTIDTIDTTSENPPCVSDPSMMLQMIRDACRNIRFPILTIADHSASLPMSAMYPKSASFLLYLRSGNPRFITIYEART